MRYRQITDHPAPGTIAQVTIVPVLPDGTLGALRPDDELTDAAPVEPGRAAPVGTLVLIHGEVTGAESLDEGAARIAAAQAGLDLGPVQVVGAEGLPDAQHVIVWAQSRSASAADRDQGHRLLGLTPDELRRRVAADQGLIPGGASAAWIVADAAATIARRGPAS